MNGSVAATIANMGVMRSNVDCTMGRMGRMAPWVPWWRFPADSLRYQARQGREKRQVPLEKVARDPAPRRMGRTGNVSYVTDSVNFFDSWGRDESSSFHL